MFDIGIIDPTKVVKTALINAASVAGLLLLTDCAIYEDEDEQEKKKEQEEEQEEKQDGPYEPILTKEELEGESGQDAVAGNRVMDLLKELETARKERDHDPAKAATTEK